MFTAIYVHLDEFGLKYDSPELMVRVSVASPTLFIHCIYMVRFLSNDADNNISDDDNEEMVWPGWCKHWILNQKTSGSNLNWAASHLHSGTKP